MADTYTVQRSATIAASPQTVYALVVDFHRWRQWSPWEELDPEMKRSHSGSQSGVGAVYSWSGNRKAGQGRMEITEAAPSSRVAMRLDFIKPFASTNGASFTLTPRGARTEVVWEMHGPSSFLQRVMGVFFDVEKMMGKNFEDGLADLRRQAEA